MVDVVYIAAARDPQNKQIGATLAQGLEDCIIVHPSTPSDIVSYITDEHNNFHMGSPSILYKAYNKSLSSNVLLKITKESRSVPPNACMPIFVAGC